MALAALAPRRPIAGPVLATDPLRRRMPVRALVVHQAEVVRAGVSTLLTTAGPVRDDARRLGLRGLPGRRGDPPRPHPVRLPPRARARRPRACSPACGRARASSRSSPAAPRSRPRACLRAGADAAIAIENVSGGQFLAAVEHAIDGRGPAVAGFPRTGPHPIEADIDESPTAMLTPREREMLFLIGEGLSNREIAESLVLSVKTVETHRANLSRKLNVRSRAGLMRLAMGIRLGSTAAAGAL